MGCEHALYELLEASGHQLGRSVQEISAQIAEPTRAPVYSTPIRQTVRRLMAIGVVCPCGVSLSNFADNVPFLADFLPDQKSDAYCGAIEEAIRRHPGELSAR